MGAFEVRKIIVDNLHREQDKKKQIIEEIKEHNEEIIEFKKTRNIVGWFVWDVQNETFRHEQKILKSSLQLIQTKILTYKDLLEQINNNNTTP